MKISVIIPAYEAGLLLLEALQSLAEQEGLVPGKDFEAVVADDGATRPESLQGLEVAKRWAWVRVVKTAGRIGPAGARNLAAGVASGEWLAFLDADDRYAPNALISRLDTAHGYPEVGCSATDYAHFPAGSAFDPEGLRGVIAWHETRRAPVAEAFDEQRAILLDRPLRTFVGKVPLWTGSVLVRKSAFDRLGGFPSGHFIGEDTHLWLRIAASERIVFAPEITAYCRKGHASLTAGESEMNLKTARCYEDLIADPLMAPVERQLRQLIAQSYLGQSYLARGRHDIRAAYSLALHALRWAPMLPAAWRALALAILPSRAGKAKLA
jgi:GT2 family glycosyltransferase